MNSNVGMFPDGLKCPLSNGYQLPTRSWPTVEEPQEVLYRLPKEKHKKQLSHKTFDLQSVPPAKYEKEMVIQSLW